MNDPDQETGQTPARKKSGLRKRFILLILICVAASLLWAYGWIGNTAQRIESEHSIVLPASVRHIRCEGFMNFSFIDTTTMATFEVPKGDVDGLLQQFKGVSEMSTKDLTFWAGSMKIPVNFHEVLSSLEAGSKDGNRAIIQVYRIDDTYCGICLKTAWN